jgi:BirA family biotin operon repressor/biotin-[acetyl-CoA-carboxylase] ligase
MPEGNDDLIGLADRLERAIAREGLTCFNRVGVVRETHSTQDFARMLAAGTPGLVAIAGRQTAGRGRLGRKWADTSRKGVAMTFALGAQDLPPERLSIAAGVACCLTIEAALTRTSATVGLRWPNDVVERTEAGPGRKLSGVLIEQQDGLALVGIGINVLQLPEDWDDDLAPKVTSLRELGSTWSRAQAAERLMIELDRALRTPPDELARLWGRREALIGRRCAFLSDGAEYRGIVEAVDPATRIRLRTDDGRTVLLPALTTSMIHEQ